MDHQENRRPSKRTRQRQRRRTRILVLMISLLLIVAIGAGGTVAYLLTKTGETKNTFTPGVVSCKVVETFDKQTKTDVKVQNTGNTDAYLRALIVATWVKEDGTTLAAAPQEATDYTLRFAENSGWLEINGYWYYTRPVAPTETTAALIDSCTLAEGASVPEGCHLSVEIIASAVQSVPANVAAEKWNLTIDANGTITGSGVTGA